MYDLHKLRLLRELKLRGTVTAVGEALSYSPSTVSQHLAQLESQVGVKLLEQVGRRLALTSAAEMLVRHTEAVMTRLEQAEADIASTRQEVVGVLRLAAFQTAALALVPPTLTMLYEHHPLLRVEVDHLEEQQAQAAVLARDFDLVITEEFPHHPASKLEGLNDQPLLEDKLRLVLSKDLLDTAKTTGLAAAKSLPWVLQPEGTTGRTWASTLCRRAGFEPDVRFQANDVLFHLQLAVEGKAAALLPDLIWRTAPLPQSLSLSGELGTRKIFTSVRSGSERSPAIIACRTALLTAASLRRGLPVSS